MSNKNMHALDHDVFIWRIKHFALINPLSVCKAMSCKQINVYLKLLLQLRYTTYPFMNYLMPQTANVAEQVKVLTITQHVQLKVAKAFNETNLQPFVPNEKGFGGLVF